MRTPDSPARPFAVALLVLTLPIPWLAAQRGEAGIDWPLDRGTALRARVSYGEVRVGDHSLSELPVGGTWRMGQDHASTLHTTLPLVPAAAGGFGGLAVAPGSYRVGIERRTATRLDLTVVGAGLAGAAEDAAAHLPGALREVEDATPRLELEWTFADVPEDRRAAARFVPPGPSHASALELRFGRYRLAVPVEVVQGVRHRLKRGWELDLFRWPERLLDQQVALGGVPIARLHRRSTRRGEDVTGWNLFVDREEARLVPTMQAPTASFGFGEVEPPDAERIVAGSAEWFGATDADGAAADGGDAAAATTDRADESEVPGEDGRRQEPPTALELVGLDHERSADGPRLILDLKLGARALTVRVTYPRMR